MSWNRNWIALWIAYLAVIVGFMFMMTILILELDYHAQSIGQDIADKLASIRGQ